MKKEVQLVLRGEDKGLTKSLNGAVAALRELTGVQGELNRSASGTGRTVDKLGLEFASLGKELQGLTALGKVSAELDKVTKSNNQSIASVREAKTAAASLLVEYAKFAQRSRELAAAVAQSNSALNDQRVAHKTAKTDLSAIDAQVKRVEASYLKHAEAVRRANDPYGERARLLQTEGRKLEFLYALQSQGEQVLSREGLLLEKASSAHKANTEALKAATTQRNKLKATYESTAATIAKQAENTAKEKAALIALTGEAKRSADALGLTLSNQEELARSSAVTTSALEKLTAALKRQEAAQESAQRAASVKLTGASAADDSAQFRAQISSTSAARQAMIAAREEATRLGKEFAATTNPSRAMSASFEAARINAKAATQEYYNQGVALNALRSSLTGTTSSLAALKGVSQSAFAGAAVNIGRVSKISATSADSMATLSKQVNNAKASFSLFSDESRKAMSIAQRMRGQILSLASAYIGLFGVINEVSKVTDSIRTLDAVTTRLGVAFGDDSERIANEIKFLQAQAVRLGFSFKNLGGEYAKFAIAAKNSNFTSQETRDVFMSIAEAGRVLNLSTDESERVFRAFNQMMDKGVISSEELKGQIGDNGMAGAFQLFAKALGYTTSGLMDAMKAGEVFADRDTMLRVGKMLREEYGKQLPKALETLGANIDRTTALFENFRLKIGQGGFGENLRKSLNDLNNALAGGAGDKWAQKFSSALSLLVDAITIVVKNLDLLMHALSIFLTLKIAGAISGWLTSLTNLAIQFRTAGLEAEKAALSQKAFGIATVAATSRLTVAARATLTWRNALLTLRGAMLAFKAAMGGFLGIVGSVATFVVTEWLINSKSATDLANDALSKHADLLEKVRQKYVESRGDIEQWSVSLKGATAGDIKANLEVLKKSLNEVRQEVETPSVRGVENRFFSAQIRNAVRKTIEDFKAGKTSTDEFRAELEKLQDSFGRFLNPEVIQRNRQYADSVDEISKAIEEEKAALAAATGTVVDTTKKTLDLGDAVSTATDSFSNIQPLERWKDKLNELKEMVPELADEMSRLKELSKINELVDGVTGMGPHTQEQLEKYKELLQLAERARGAVDLKAIGSQITGVSALEKSVSLLKGFESFSAKPYYDVNAFRAGYGSDTVTLSDGSIKKITQGMSVTQTDALRDLVRRIGEFQSVIKGQIGAERFASFTPDQQAALTSIAYNYGALPERIVEAVKNGSAQQIGDAVRGLRGDNGGTNAGRRDKEAAILSQASYGLNVNNSEAAAEKAKAEAAATQSIRDSIVERTRELSLMGLGSREQAIQKALDEERAKLKEANRDLTQAEVSAITELTGKLWDVQNAESQINDLKEKQASLQEKIRVAEQQGDTQKVVDLQVKLTGVNTQLDGAINKTIAMWQGYSGEGATAAIERLKEIQAETRNVGVATDLASVRTKEWAAQINTDLVNGAMSAFDSFSQAVAAGENVFSSLKNAFLQFASTFLQNIAKMIMQQALLNAIGGGVSGSSAGAGGGIAGFIAGLFHTGGVVGSGGGASRSINPAVFAGAMRYHTGGIAGLRPGEVPAILKKGEEVLTANDPRHIMNGSGGASQNVKIVNAIDAGGFVSEGLNTSVGEKAILNFIRTNSSAVKSAMGV